LTVVAGLATESVTLRQSDGGTPPDLPGFSQLAIRQPATVAFVSSVHGDPRQ
jgi:hypothetical protein